jgi:hypothetical protein
MDRFLSLPDAANAQSSLDEFRAAGAASCVFEKGKVDDAVAKLEKIGFTCVYRSPFLDAITCQWKGDLTKKMLEDLKVVPSLLKLEPAPEIVLTDEIPSVDHIPDQSLKAFQWAGAMTCVYKEGKKADALQLVKELQLKCVYESYSQSALVCE